MLKVTGPPKSYWPEIFFIDLKNHYFCNISHYKLKNANLAIIFFTVGDLLSCFQSVFRMADNVVQELFENHNYAFCRIWRTMGDAATCVSSYSLLYSKIRRANWT